MGQYSEVFIVIVIVIVILIASSRGACNVIDCLRWLIVHIGKDIVHIGKDITLARGFFPMYDASWQDYDYDYDYDYD